MAKKKEPQLKTFVIDDHAAGETKRVKARSIEHAAWDELNAREVFVWTPADYAKQKREDR